MAEDLKRKFTKSFRQIWMSLDMDEIDKLFHKDCKIETNLGEGEGSGAVKDFVRYWSSRFYDMEMHTFGEFRDGNNVFIQWRCSGTHVGKFEVDPDKVDFQFEAMNRATFKYGKVIKFWSYIDF